MTTNQKLSSLKTDVERVVMAARVVRHAKNKGALEFAAAMAELDEAVYAFEEHERWRQERATG